MLRLAGSNLATMGAIHVRSNGPNVIRAPMVLTGDPQAFRHVRFRCCATKVVKTASTTPEPKAMAFFLRQWCHTRWQRPNSVRGQPAWSVTFR